MYLRQAWRDKRLQFDDDEHEKIKLTEDNMYDLWLPDTFMRNEKEADVHGMTRPNQLLRINANGHVWYVIQ